MNTTKAAPPNLTPAQRAAYNMMFADNLPTATLVEVVQANIVMLTDALNTRLPAAEDMLAEIHAKLHENPVVVTLLTDTDIAALFTALMQHKQTCFNAPLVSKAKRSPSTKQAQLAIEDEVL